jgi:outer membrane receptor for ferrienterochelin and colicin
MQFKRGILKADLSGRHYRNRLPATLNPAVLTSGFTPFSRPLYEMNDRTNETFGAQVSVMPLNWWLHRVTAGVDRHVHKATQTQRRFTTPGDTLLALSDGRSRKLSFSYHTIATITRTGVVGGSMTMGIDYYDRESNVFSTTRALNTDGTIITSPPGSFQRTRTRIRNTGYFAQGQVSLRESLFMTAAIRAEESTTFGVDLTTPLLPRVGLSFVPVRGRTTVKLRGSWGRGIRSPSPGQAFGLANAFQIHLANTTLAPEEQAGWDAGIDITLGSTASLSLTGFDQTASNLIILIPLASTPIPVYQFQNTGQVSNRGVEVEASLVRRELTLKAHYSYVRSRIAALGPTFDGDLQIGDQPEGIPAHTAAATMTYASRTGTTVTAAATHIGNLRGSDAVGLFRCLGGTGPCPSGSRFSITYPALTKFNVGVRRRLSQSLEGYLAIDNLTNNQSYEADNINPVLGRLTMAGLQAAF